MKVWVVSIAALGLTSCGSEQTVSNVPDATTSTAAASSDAKAVTEALLAKGLPIENIVVVTEANDSNKLLGRPGQYISKTYFADKRHAGEGNNPAEQNTVEVFASVKEATLRREYIQRVTEGVPMFTQYIIQSGPTVLRLDNSLTPTEAKAYEAALAN